MTSHPADQIKDKFLASNRIFITSHLRPDGDSICTSLALYFMGKQLDKDVSIYIKDRIPFPFNNYPDVEVINIGQMSPDGHDLIILLECANVSRSGQNNINDCFTINIDHHHSNDYYADINWVEPEAAAVACLAFELGKKLNIEFNPKLATQLYSAIVSDTGSFQFSNTKAHAFDICHQLVNYGAVPVEVSELLFNNNPPEKIQLLGKVLSTLKMNREGNIAIITMFKKFLTDLNLKEIDTEDIMTYARTIKGAQMVLFFKEIKTGIFRVSVRSKGIANSTEVAEYFEGGGHLHAAGFTVSGKHEHLIIEIPEIANKILNKNIGKPG